MDEDLDFMEKNIRDDQDEFSEDVEFLDED